NQSVPGLHKRDRLIFDEALKINQSLLYSRF
ncbi:MAG: hypothetical protein JWQ69_1251, partial [Pseudomonas sp.]|nr:hypothetical protein [Pseudomonas sp.]